MQESLGIASAEVASNGVRMWAGILIQFHLPETDPFPGFTAHLVLRLEDALDACLLR